MPLVIAALDSLPGRPFGELGIAPDDLDIHECTDLLACGGRIRIAVRVRGPNLVRFRDNLTIRAEVASGANTEIDKLGHAPHFYFLGIAGFDGASMPFWRLYDRDTVLDVLGRLPRPLAVNRNGDGTAFVDCPIPAERALHCHDDRAGYDRPVRERLRQLNAR